VDFDSFKNMNAHSLRARLRGIISSFSPAERAAYYILLITFVISALLTAWHVNQSFLVEIPQKGGALTEGVIGAPRFINPLLAVSDADRDLTALVYSGLMRLSADGSLKHDLAVSHDISDDGLTYTFTIREDAVFHDGSPVTAEDVIFTVQRAQDPALKSPKRASWEGIAVQAVDPQTVLFTLNEPYAPFLQNTTLGILPKHIWNQVNSEQFSFSQFNVEPVGSGPYEIEKIRRDDSGVPKQYTLKPFSLYTLGSPHIAELHMRFFPNEEKMLEAFRDDDIDAINAVSPKTATALANEGYHIKQSPLPRVFGVFFNQNEAPLFTDIAVRKALDVALDKQNIVDQILHGYGTPIDGPIPPGSLGYTRPDNDHDSDDDPSTGSAQESSGQAPGTTEGEGQATEGGSSNNTNTATSTPPRIAEARAILERNGWERNEEGIYESADAILSFTMSTSDVSELHDVGMHIKEQWEQLGAQVMLETFAPSDLNQNVIRPRNYGALLFGEIVGRDSDLFAFWHSSQRNDPGLNIALYANITTDKLLEETRSFSDTQTRVEKYKALEEEIQKDKPAIFVYAPDFVYALPKHIKGASIGSVTTPSERFLNIHEWFIKTDHVWTFFAPKEASNR